MKQQFEDDWTKNHPNEDPGKLPDGPIKFKSCTNIDPIKSDQGSNKNNNRKEYDISDNDIPKDSDSDLSSLTEFFI